MATKAEKEALAEEARDRLTALLPPGSTVYTTLNHVSRSGMARDITAHVIRDNEPQWLSSRWLVALGVGDRSSANPDAVRMGGGGMDMGFALVYNLSRSLYPRGFGCIGEGCPSNDHSNGDRDYVPHLTVVLTRHRVGGLSYNILHDERGHATGMLERDHWHASGGYALKQRWL